MENITIGVATVFYVGHLGCDGGHPTSAPRFTQVRAAVKLSATGKLRVSLERSLERDDECRDICGDEAGSDRAELRRCRKDLRECRKQLEDVQKALQVERKAREEAEETLDCVRVEIEGWGRLETLLRAGMPLSRDTPGEVPSDL